MDIAVSFRPPEWGWIDVRFSAGAQSLEIALTNVWDRLLELVDWLESVWQRRALRFWYDVEGRELELHAWIHGDDVHLVIAENTCVGRYEKINVQLDRDTLVRSMYRALIEFWESPLLVDNWKHWASDIEADDIEVDEDGKELHPYRLRSATLDQLLTPRR